MRGDEKQRKYALTRVLGITALLFLMLVSTASAEQTIIDSITTDPEHPAYKGNEYDGMYDSDLTIIVHVTNPPTGGWLSYDYGCAGSGTVLIDDNGMASFPISLGYHIPFMHQCPPAVFLYVYDNQQNLVSSAEKYVEIDLVRTPIITWNPPEDISTKTPLSSILNAAANLYGGYSVPGTFVYTPAEGTVLSAGTHTFHVDFIPDYAGYTTASKDVTIQVWDPAIPEIGWSDPEDITYGTPLTSTQLNAVSPWVDGTFVYTPAEGTVLSAGTHTLHVDFIPDDTEMYATASKDVTINVLTHVQEIQQIITTVQSLNLIPEQANLLIVKLDAAILKLNKGNTLAATNDLNAFINQVSADINNGKISSTEGQALIDDTNNLINVINFLNPPKKSVPEFPSVALPVISVVGLLLVFGRKKNS